MDQLKNKFIQRQFNNAFNPKEKIDYKKFHIKIKKNKIHKKKIMFFF